MAVASDATGRSDELRTLAETGIGPYLEPLSHLHRVLCPRQVLGVRVALLAARYLDLSFPQTDKRAVILTELDGCFADGLSVVSGCSIGHRTLRLADLGKLAATVVDTRSSRAVRVWPRPDIRMAAPMYAESDAGRWHKQRLGYARMPDSELLCARSVPVPQQVLALQGSWTRRTVCGRCGEEVFNARHVVVDGVDVCRTCVLEGVDDVAG